MFKKLKDKIAEEVKQSPLKSVQQLASAVVSPSSSSVFEPSSNDHFCIDDDDEEENQETPKNSPAKVGGFTTVNLHGQTSSSPLDASFSQDTTNRSRRSSISSVASDASSFFPRYEPSTNNFHLQSDLESASEVEDALNVQLERVSKENLYEAYRKLRMRYNKYKGRFVDLAEHYRRLEKENLKCKNILSDTQDKALRRISELREQCALEQEAKAHLEEALRSDLEEKDHLIRTLNTKIELLKKGDEVESPFLTGISESKNLMDFSNNTSSEEVKVLEEKVRKFEVSLEESKASILEKNENITKQQNELASVKNLYSQKLSLLTKDLNAAKGQVEQLQNTISLMKKNEEEAALSLAENKLSVHKELEMRDEQLKKYKNSVEDLSKEKEDLNNKVNQLQNDLSAFNGSNRVTDEERADLLQELSRGKSEAVKLMQEKIVSIEKSFSEKLKIKESEMSNLMVENSILSQKVKDFEEKVGDVESNLNEGESFEEGKEIQVLKDKIEDLENELKATLAEKENLIGQIAKCEKEIQKLETDGKSILEQKNLEIKSLKILIDNHKQENKELEERYQSYIQRNKKLEDEISLSKRQHEKELEKMKSKLDSELDKLKSLCSSKDEELIKSIKAVERLEKIEKDLIESEKLQSSLNQQLSNKTRDLELKDTVLQEKIGLVENQEKVIQVLHSNIKELNTRISNLDEKYNESQKERSILENKLSSEDSLRTEIIEKLKEDKFSIEKQLKDAENRIVCLENDMEAKEVMLSEKKKEVDTYITDLQKREDCINLLKQDIAEQRQKLNDFSSLDSELFSLRKIIVIIKSVVDASGESVDNVSNSSDRHSNERTVKSNIQEEGKVLIDHIRNLKSRLEEKENDVGKLASEINESKILMKNLQTEMTQSSQNHIENNSNRKEILNHLDINKRLLEDMKGQYNVFASDTKSDLESALNSFQFVKKTFLLLERSIVNTENVNAKQNEELKEKYEEEKFRLQEKFNSFESEISSLKDSCRALEDKLNVETNKCHILEEKLENCVKQSESKTKVIVKLQKVLRQLHVIERKFFSGLNENIEELKSELLSKETQLISFINQLKSAEDEKNNECQALKDNITFLKSEISSLKTKYDHELSNKNQIVLIKESEIETEKETMNVKIEEMERKLQEQTSYIGEIEENLSRLKTSILNKDDLIEVLKSDLEAMKNKILTELSSIDSQQITSLLEKIKSGSTLGTKEESHSLGWNDNIFSVQSEDSKQLENEIIKLLNIVELSDHVFSSMEGDINSVKSELEILTNKYLTIEDGRGVHLDKNLSEGFPQLFSNSLSKIKELSSVMLTMEENFKRQEFIAKNLQSQNTDLIKECDTLKASRTKLSEKVINLEQNLKQGSVSNTGELLNATSQLQSLKEEYDQLQSMYKGKCEEISNLSEELNSWRQPDSLRRQLEFREVDLGDTNCELETIKAENENLKEKIEDIESNQNQKIKQLILEFNTKIAEKDEEISAAELKKFDRKEAEDNFLFVELKQQIKDLQQQLEASCEAYETKLADCNLTNEGLERNLEDLKSTHVKEMREQDKKWRACLDRRLLEAEKKYKEEIDELSKEWQNERKLEVPSKAEEHLESKELEHSSRLAVAAMESGASSSELLRKQVTSLTNQLEDIKLQHKHEISELQKFLAMKKHTKDKQNDLSIEDCTEMEYLRNILFQYMMGKEPVIMAKVLSAIVKFDHEQTNKILQKEEQKLSLLRKVSSLMPKE